MPVIIVAGIPGAGSSTVVKKALELNIAQHTNFVSINYGDAMFEAAKEEGRVEKRDEIRKLPIHEQWEIQRIAGERVAELGKNILIDTHCTIKTPLGYLPGLPEPVLRELKPVQFVLIEATAEEILHRRYKDKTRNRDVEDKRSIEEHHMVNRATAMAYACLTGASVKIIENHDGAIEEAAEKFQRLLKSYLEKSN